ncbi:putative membrane protein [Fimbriiglobus ruber]|uniref:Putative membrane protein n=1 Tax=Fimbriiglobus ruber TaxID=1908690 RepID=A0A225DGE1_9BACT|nr:putative membrane protein [Fimbriiglobus ruber]
MTLPTEFWTDVFPLDRPALMYLWRVFRQAAVFAIAAALIYLLDWAIVTDLSIAVAPYEVSGAALSLLLVLRTNAGYDRWWEARKLWGGIVNQSRNLVVIALAYGPPDAAWRANFVRKVAAFAPAAREVLCQPPGATGGSGHPALNVMTAVARMLREAVDAGGMSPFAFQRAERERAALVDHLGGCERILKTPLPRAYAVSIHQFIALFLLALPFALITRVGWLTPLVTLFVAYPILALDQIGRELQSPFSVYNLTHLPLDTYCQTIETNLLDLLDADQKAAKEQTKEET